jgi:hypothetical protein
MSEQRTPCRWWHRWDSIEEAEWVGSVVFPVLRHTCRRCGATTLRRYGP